MKKILPLLTTTAILFAALLPLSIAHAQGYEPGYTCHYRDIAGQCLSNQKHDPYFFHSAHRYPFQRMSNAYSTQKSTWDNRFNNRRNYWGVRRYEEDDDDNTYLDDDDDAYDYFYGDHDYRKNKERNGSWEWYLDDEDDTYRQYRFQDDDDFYGHRRRRHRSNNDTYYEEYEHTRYICTGGSCDSTNIRY